MQDASASGQTGQVVLSEEHSCLTSGQIPALPDCLCCQLMSKRKSCPIRLLHHDRSFRLAFESRRLIPPPASASNLNQNTGRRRASNEFYQESKDSICLGAENVPSLAHDTPQPRLRLLCSLAQCGLASGEMTSCTF